MRLGMQMGLAEKNFLANLMQDSLHKDLIVVSGLLQSYVPDVLESMCGALSLVGCPWQL